MRTFPITTTMHANYLCGNPRQMKTLQFKYAKKTDKKKIDVFIEANNNIKQINKTRTS